MKDKLFNSLSGSARSGIVTAVAVVCGYWVSQILAANFVSSAEMGSDSKLVGGLFLALFGVLFVVHLFGPWSKTAAIFGLCSFAVFVGTMWYYTNPGFAHYFPSTKLAILASTIFGVAGIALDVERCWRLCRLELSQSLWLKLRHNVVSRCHHAIHPNHN